MRKTSSSWELACKVGLFGGYKIKPSGKPNESNGKIGIDIMAVTVWFRTANTEKARTRLCSPRIICYLIKPPTRCFTETKSNFWWRICISVFSNQALPVEHSTFVGQKWIKQEREAHLQQLIILYVLFFYSVERIHIKQTSKKQKTNKKTNPIYISGITATNKQKKKSNCSGSCQPCWSTVFAHDLLLKCRHICRKENTFRRVIGE